MQETRAKERTRISKRKIERASRIVRLQCDVQLAEDYYLSKWEREEYRVSVCAWEREKERGGGGKDEETKRRGGEGNVTSSIMVQLLLCTTYSGWARRVGLYMLLHCGAQCSIISPSIPSALIEERVRRAGAREGGRLGKKSRKWRRGCRWPHSDDIVYHFSL